MGGLVLYIMRVNERSERQMWHLASSILTYFLFFSFQSTWRRLSPFRFQPLRHFTLLNP